MSISISPVEIDVVCSKCFAEKTIDLFSHGTLECDCGGTFKVNDSYESENCPHCQKKVKIIKTKNGVKLKKEE